MSQVTLFLNNKNLWNRQNSGVSSKSNKKGDTRQIQGALKEMIFSFFLKNLIQLHSGLRCNLFACFLLSSSIAFSLSLISTLHKSAKDWNEGGLFSWRIKRIRRESKKKRPKLKAIEDVTLTTQFLMLLLLTFLLRFLPSGKTFLLWEEETRIWGRTQVRTRSQSHTYRRDVCLQWLVTFSYFMVNIFSSRKQQKVVAQGRHVTFQRHSSSFI